MTDQCEAHARFKALHEGDGPFVMPNAWDGGSAALLAEAGFQALGSSSAAIAWALGRNDGVRAVLRAAAVANARLLAEVSGLPVNGDLEDGFGPDPADCAETIEAGIVGGLAGLGIEDTTADPDAPIHGFDAAVARVRAAAERATGRILLTGRTDLLLQGFDDLDEVVRRLVAFAEVGADVLYAPGLSTIEQVRTVTRAVAPKPVNVLASPRLPLDALAEAGVRRVSLGATLYAAAMGGLALATDALARGDMAEGAKGYPVRALLARFARG